MAKKEKSISSKEKHRLWDGIEESDYAIENNIEDKEMGQYNLEKMGIYALNANCSRHILALLDSLKPVERRILYSMYLLKAHRKMGGKKKSLTIVGDTNKFHPHGGVTIYDTMVGMSQYWKKGIPLIRIYGAKGNPTIKKHADQRYTEAELSDYAYECFFEDFDPSCTDMMLAANMEDVIPVALPSKFPNILTNGGIGISYGYSFTIPPYNPDDVIMATKRLLKDRNDQDFFIYPDLPTGCDIVDDGSELHNICETGTGKLHMRAHIDIIEETSKWILRITSIPWLTSPLDIKESIRQMQKRGEVQIQDICDYSDQYKMNDGTLVTEIQIDILLNKALDPYAIRELLYRNTGLDRTIAVQFRMVEEGINIVKKNMYEVLNDWIDERREYLRRLYNKKISYTSARIAFLQALIKLKDEKAMNKVIHLIRTAKSDNEVIEFLTEKFDMNSYQAAQIAEVRLKAFNAGKMKDYENELPEQINKLNEYKEIIRNEKHIDKVIEHDMEDLRKYSHPRRSHVISNDSGQLVADTEHILVFTKKGLVKKLPVTPVGRNKGYGQFGLGDYPINRIKISNMDSVILFDSLGKYSVIPVSQIQNTMYSDPGESVFNVSKLEGEIISVYPFYTPKNQRDLKKINSKGAYVFTLTKSGQMKKTPLSEFTSLRLVKNARAIRGKKNEQLAMAEILLDTGNIMVYSKNGMCSILSSDDVPEMGKDSIGNIVLNISGDDECVGFCCVGNKNGHAKEILVVTEKGCMKRVDCESGLFNAAVPMKRRSTVYLTSVSNDDKVIQCLPITEKHTQVIVCNRKDVYTYDLDMIRKMSRKASCQKYIPVPVGDNIITVTLV